MRKMQIEQASQVIRGFYDAAVEPDRWEVAFDGLSDLLGGCAIGSSLQWTDRPAQLLAYSRFDSKASSTLVQHFATAKTNPMVATMARLPQGSPYARSLAIADDAYFSSDLYNEAFRPSGIVHAAVALAHRSAELYVPFAVFRRTDQDEFGDGEWEILDLMMPHLEKALEVFLKLEGLRATQGIRIGSLDSLPYGVMFLDSSGKIWCMNRMAERIAGSGDGLSVVQGRLRTASLVENGTLAALVANAISVARGEAVAAAGHMAVTRPSMSRPYGILVQPDSPESPWHGGAPGAVVLITDPEERITPVAEVVRSVFCLTPVQASLAALLAAGWSVDEAARRMGIQLSTARVHLKAIFERTSTRRQADLVRLVLGSVAALAIPEDQTPDDTTLAPD